MVTSQAAIDTELGVLKTGKEADANLIERAVPGSNAVGEACLMVAKRYRDDHRRTFHRSTGYTAGRRTGNTRDMRALAGRSSYGRAVAASQFARAEWEALVTCHRLGLTVPYPVQIDGTETLTEWISVNARLRRGRARPVRGPDGGGHLGFLDQP